jgi:hypothetical protein
MPITQWQLRAQLRELRVLAEDLLMSELPLSDGDLTYLVSVVGVSDEILCAVGSRQAARTLPSG